MQELTLIEIFKYAIKAMASSQVFILFVLEAVVLLLALIFRKFMSKKIVDRTCVITSLIILGFYISNYIGTVVTFMNNVTTRFMEFLYFPTTLEFVVVMLISFGIMLVTLFSKKEKTLVKVINTALPISISFIFLSIIEYINTNNVSFNEFSVFTDVNMTSLYELAMGLFIAWIVGFIIYKIDLFVINHVLDKETKEVVKESNTDNLVTVKYDALEYQSNTQDDDIEMPKLKSVN